MGCTMGSRKVVFRLSQPFPVHHGRLWDDSLVDVIILSAKSLMQEAYTCLQGLF